MEIIPAPFRHAPEELRRAVAERRQPEWRGWFAEITDYLRPLMAAFARGEPDAHLPVELVWYERYSQTRLRPFLPAVSLLRVFIDTEGVS